MELQDGGRELPCPLGNYSYPNLVRTKTMKNEVRSWDCACGNVVKVYRLGRDTTCSSCGQWFNSAGQRLRNDWMNNRSCWDEEVSDMDGYEEEYAGD